MPVGSPEDDVTQGVDGTPFWQKPDSAPIPPGTNIGRYVLLEQIGTGGMGVVYKAYDPQLDRGVAIKLITLPRQETRGTAQIHSHLLREAQALARLTHANVVAVHDAGLFEDHVFVTMELLDGKTLRTWLRERQRSWREVVDVMIAAGHGLEAAHQAGLVHQDVKTDHVIITADGRVKMIDFGVARIRPRQEPSQDHLSSGKDDAQVLRAADTDESDDAASDPQGVSLGSGSRAQESPPDAQSSSTEGVFGTPMYMAPEQHLAQPADEKSDQFSFCVVLYEALYYQRPFSGTKSKNIARQVLKGVVLPPPEGTDVPGWLHRAVVRGLSTEKADRHPSMRALLDELTRHTEGLRRQARTTRRWTVGVALTVTVMAAIAVWYELGLRRGQQCQGANAEFQGVWDPQRQRVIGEAFRATALSYAQNAWQTVKRLLNAYRQAWVDMYTDACLATRVRGTQSEELLDLRMACLSQRLRELRALVDVFSAPDATVVGRAVQAALGLPSLSACADAESLLARRARVAPPKDERTRVKVHSVVEQLARARSLVETGQLREAHKLAVHVVNLARQAGYGPVLALALSSLGDVQVLRRSVRASEEVTDEAYFLAFEEGAEELQALLAARMSYIFFVQGRFSEALRANRHAAVLNKRIGGDDEIGGEQQNTLAHILAEQGHIDKALVHYKRAVKLWRKAFGSEHPKIAIVLCNIGITLRTRGDLESAIAYLEDALSMGERMLGEKHPENINVLIELGRAHERNGELEKGLQLVERGLAIANESVGAENDYVAEALSVKGSLLLAMNRQSEAARAFEHSAGLCAKVSCQVHMLPDLHFGLAQTLWQLGHDRARAIKSARIAHAEYAKMGTPESEKQYAEVDSWLEERVGTAR